MVAIPRECDRGRLTELLSDRLPATRRDETERHLETCAVCRQDLESLAGVQSDWQAVSNFLRRDASDPASLLSSSLAKSDGAERPAAPEIGEVLRRFAPSENPAMLGRVGDYDILEVIGGGGMGVVFKGYDRDLNRFVAIKVLWPHFAVGAAARKRFSREAKAAAAVVHPHVVSIHRVAEGEEIPFIVMQFVPGQSLQQRIDAEAPLELKEILRIGMQAAQGLSAAHAQGLVHRDIKPGNILLENGVERVLLSDFGLARAADDASLTQSGVIAGTPQFMSPEQAQGAALDARSDLFSLGSVIYAMCAGHSPFRAETAVGALGRIFYETPRPLRQINPDVPAWLQRIVERLLEKRPEDRFQTANEVAELLGQWLAHVQQPDLIPPPAADDGAEANIAGPPRRRRRNLISAAGGAFLILAGVLLFLQTNKGTLRIESSVDDVSIRVTRGDKVYDRLNVSKKGESIRVGAGQYQIAIEGKHDGLTVKGARVSVTRGGTEVVKIVEEKEEALLGFVPDKIARHPEKLGVRPFERSPGATNDPTKPLSEVVREFNEKNANHPIGREQPELTEDEVIASIRWAIHEKLAKSWSDEEVRQFRDIAETRLMLSNWRLGATTSWSDSYYSNSFRGWRVSLTMRRPDGPGESFPVRYRWLSELGQQGQPIELGPMGHVPAGEVSLDAAIHEFNAAHPTVEGQKRPPLTEHEVLAAIKRFQRKDAPVWDDEFGAFKQIAETRRLPKGAKIEVTQEMNPGDDFTYHMWSVGIKMPRIARPEKEENALEGRRESLGNALPVATAAPYTFEIRKQFIRAYRIIDGPIAWGQPGTNGLRVGVKFLPHSDQYVLGQTITPTFYFQNTSGEILDASLPNLLGHNYHKGMNVLDSNGKQIAVVYKAWKPTAWRQLKLPPNTEIQVRSVPIQLGEMDRIADNTNANLQSQPVDPQGVTTLIRAQPGQSIRVRFFVPNYADRIAQPLETGEVRFVMAEDPASQ